MARGRHYAKLSLSNAARLSFSDLCILLFMFLSLCRLCVCVFLCSHWSLVDVPLIFFCPADHVPDWQPRVLLGMVEARSVNVKKTTTLFCTSKRVVYRSTPVAQLAPRNLLTRWDVSSIPANGIFLTKNKKTKIKMPNGWRTINSLVHKIRFHGRRGKGMAESFSRQKSRHAPQKEGGLKILCDLPPV